MLFEDPTMTDLKLSFDSETMLGLSAEQFKQLSTAGETITHFAPAKDYWIDPELSRLSLAFDGSLSDYYFEYEPKKDIDTFTRNSFVINFYPKTGKIMLIDNYKRPLYELLFDRRHDEQNFAEIEKGKFLNEQEVFMDRLREISVSSFLTTGGFKGSISCCDCGIEGCSGEYLWAEDYIGLVSFHVVAGGLKQVRLFPFKLV
jgi:hypothetical protein